MTKLLCLGFAMFCIGSLASLTMTPPAAVAWAERHEAQTNAPESYEVILPTIEIVGKVPTTILVSHEEYDVGSAHIIADGEAFIYASR